MTSIFTFAQIQLADTSSLVTVQAGEMTLSYWELAFKGGWVMVPIIFLSIIAVFIFVERFFVLRATQQKDVNLMNRIKDNIQDKFIIVPDKFKMILDVYGSSPDIIMIRTSMRQNIKTRVSTSFSLNQK